jgi:hypothetical protein
MSLCPSSQFPSDASNLNDLASRIANDIIPPIADCIQFYKAFSDRQTSALVRNVTPNVLKNLAEDNVRDSAEGLRKARAVQTKVLDFKNKALNVHNAVWPRLVVLYNWFSFSSTDDPTGK